MDIQKVRDRFKYYRQQIAELQEAMSEMGYRYDEYGSRCERRLRAAENERIDRENQEQADRWYREDQLRGATNDLERATSYGDEYAIKRATEKIKSLNY